MYNGKIPLEYNTTEVQHAIAKYKFEKSVERACYKSQSQRADAFREVYAELDNLVAVEPEYWKKVFLEYPYFFRCYPVKTREMCMYVLNDKCGRFTLKSIPIDLQDREMLESYLAEHPSEISETSQEPWICWFVLNIDPMVIHYIDKPTREMIDFVITISPQYIAQVNKNFLTKDDVITYIKEFSGWTVKSYFDKKWPDANLIAMHNSYVEREKKNDEEISKFVPEIMKLVNSIPLVKYALNAGRSGLIYGSFARWIVRTAIQTGIVPTMEEAINFLEESDIDIMITKQGFSFTKFVDEVRKLNGRMEFSGFEEYNKDPTQYKPVSSGRYSVGHYHVWIPSEFLFSGWIKFDFMLGITTMNDADYTVNCVKIYKNDVHAGYFDDLMTMTIKPVDLKHKHPAKQLTRLGKMIAKGYKLNDRQKPMFRLLFQRIERFGYNTLYNTTNTSKPSIGEPFTGIPVPVTKHTLTPLTKEVFDDLPVIINLREWLSE